MAGACVALAMPSFADASGTVSADDMAARTAPDDFVLTHPRVHWSARPASLADPVEGAIRRMIAAGNRIAHAPYVYGGGHGSFDATGYDCSGSVSYVLHGGGLLSVPEDSAGLESFGLPGPGRHVTIYANSEHAWMTIDGRRYDTIAFQETGTRWSSTLTSADGYVIRHPAGL
jgi:hypothetical protein